jgi:histidinol-phosphatase (PHP family)
MHVHATSSPDASLTERELALRAVEAGLDGIGFVAHVDFHPGDFCTGGFHPDSYAAACREASAASQDRVRLMMGVETGEPLRFREEIGEAVEGLPLDFVTGALHWIGDRFTLGEEAFLQGDPMELVEEYYSRTERIVSECDIDVLAHMGIFRRGMALAGKSTGFDETTLWPGMLRRILTSMIERGIALELNMAGLRRPEKASYPVPAVLGLYRKLGGELVTVGSDSHRDPWIFFGVREAPKLLREAGFERAFAYSGRRPFPYLL